jgi:hypothetical protein
MGALDRPPDARVYAPDGMSTLEGQVVNHLPRVNGGMATERMKVGHGDRDQEQVVNHLSERDSRRAR